MLDQETPQGKGMVLKLPAAVALSLSGEGSVQGKLLPPPRDRGPMRTFLETFLGQGRGIPMPINIIKEVIN